MKKQNGIVRTTYFTIITPKKDGSILDQFLEEFGYTPFEIEDREVDTRRSIKQISRNEELKEEVADFCRENNCSITLVYKEKKKLFQQLFKGKQICNPKPYEKQDLNLPQDILEKAPLNHQSTNKSLFIKNNNKKESLQRESNHLLEKEKSKEQPEVKITKKRSRRKF